MRANESSRTMNLVHLRPAEPDMRASARLIKREESCEKFRALSFDHHQHHHFQQQFQNQQQQPQHQSKEERPGASLETAKRLDYARNLKSQQVTSKTKPLKTYHPIIRLFGAFRLCMQLATFLLIVPSKLTCNFVQQQEHQLGSQTNSTTTFQRDIGSQHHTNQSSHKQHHQSDEQLANTFNRTSRFASIANVAQPSTSYSQFNGSYNLGLASAPVPIRQTLLSNLVSQQGQKILKSLVNSTIADLVAQTANRKVNLGRLVQLQQHQQSVPNQQAGQRQQQVDNLNSRFPTVGRLYTLLFPTTTTTTSVPATTAPSYSGATTPNPATNKTSKISPPSSPFHLPSRDKQDVFEASASSTSTGRHPPQEERIMRLSAPYDTRPHQSISKSSGSRRGASSEQVMARSRRDRPGSLMNEAYEPLSDMEVGSESLQEAGIDPDAMATYETADLIHSNTSDEDMATNKKPENQEIYSTGAGQTSDGDSSPEPNETQAIQDPQGLYGTRKTNQKQLQHSQHEQQQQQHNQLEESPENQANLMGSEGAEQQAVQQMEVPGEQQLDVDFNQTDQHQQQQQQNGNEESEVSSVQPDDFGQYPQSGNMSAESFRNTDNESYTGNPDNGYKLTGNESLTSAQNDDESFLTAKLPSQYDSVIRMPPEGYYDDYFKPMGNNLAPMQTSAGSTASLLNQPDSEPEFSLTPPQPPPQLPERYEFEDTPATNMSKWQHQRNQASQVGARDPASANYVPTTVDYTKQFFLNQQPLKQGETTADQNVEFVVPKVHHQQENFDNLSSIGTGKRQQESAQLNYELPTGGYEANYQANNQSSGGETDPDQHQLRTNSSLSMHNEDNIKLIMANTNSPVNSSMGDNEKIINYTSEGLNITRSAEKAPRNTFVNKDMNEFPPSDELVTSEQHPGSAGRYPTSSMRDNVSQPGALPAQLQQQQAARDEQSARLFQRPRGQMSLARPRAMPQVSTRPKQVTGAEDVSTVARAQDHDTEPEDEQLRRATFDNGYGGRFDGHRQTQQQHLQSSQQPQQIRQMDQSQPSSAPGRQVARQRDRRQRDRIPDQPQVMTSRTHHQAAGSRQNKMQTIRRPQLTQAHFDPKDLVMNSPTPMPSVTESALDTITELPTKVRQIRERQPDKNELMNELLTALDRVKVAIYKLQPLTAKMNAIYRKSITSNTRDIIMDNNKGTYAKRYPPGDYDDTYDRMHPSELLSANGAGSDRRQQQSEGPMETGESAASAVYLPAPRELLESYQRNMSSVQPIELLQGGLQLGESSIVATGIGRRLGDGRDFELRLGPSMRMPLAAASNKSATNSSGSSPTAPESPLSTESDPSDPQSPLFGYRITIFQSPDDDDASTSDADQLSYQLEGVADGDTGETSAESARVDDGDLMVTSESSVSESTTSPSEAAPTSDQQEDDGEDPAGSTGVEPEADASEAKGHKKEHKQMKEEKYSKGAGGEEAAHKKSGKNKGEKGKKSHSKKKKQEVESKKEKEFKKIKHKKGIVSKEKKTMHRDKHIKAHDRGAAKEKALKERTQIEFFEREQIVDDEYEKAKKSTKKAGWQTGHDSKKTIKEAGGHSAGHSGGEPMSMGGSHFVSHQPKDKHQDDKKSSGIDLAASSGKKSNKYEKKDMEASGKKFKGWREKGYKIITETEFIDRGSLHDSAYKKRDKGAAHHHKFKKQQASSEGQHGSMHEHHRKSAKKEEKKEKSHEKKEKHMKKVEKEKEEKKKEKKEKSAKKMDKKKKSYEKTAAASDEQPVKSNLAGNSNEDGDELDEALDLSGSMQSLSRKHQQRHSPSSQPTLLSASSSTFRPLSMQPPSTTATLGRLLNANYHQEDPQVVVLPSPTNTSSLGRNHTFNQEHPGRFMLLSDSPSAASSLDDSVRRSDGPVSQVVSKLSAAPQADKSNATTVLDIVDNLTGRQVNKTKIGTYELDGEHLQGALRLLTTNGSLPGQGRRLSKQLLPQPPIAQPQPQPQQLRVELAPTSSTRAPTRIARDRPNDLPHLINMIQQAKSQQQLLDKPQLTRSDNELRQMRATLNPVTQPPTPPPVGLISAERAQMAAQFLQQLVQRAAAQTAHHQPLEPLVSNHRQTYLPPSQPRSFSFTPQALNPFLAAGPNPFATEQFLDYESDAPIHLVA